LTDAVFSSSASYPEFWSVATPNLPASQNGLNWLNQRPFNERPGNPNVGAIGVNTNKPALENSSPITLALLHVRLQGGTVLPLTQARLWTCPQNWDNQL